MCADGSEPYEGDSGLECDDGSVPGSYVAPVASTVGTTLSTNTPVTQAAATAMTTTPVVDSSGIVWNCDANGNCCDPSGNCQQGPPTVLTSVPPNATTGQTSSASAANQSNAALVAALAAAAVAAGKSVAAPAGSIQCSSGVAVAAGQKCPGATGTSVCPAGSTLVGTTCTTSVLAGVSNSSLVVIALVAFLFVSMSGKK
jgi:hypothetical protein